MSLWIERAAARAREQALLRHTRAVLQVAQAGEGPCEFVILLGDDGGLLMTSGAGWAIERLMAEKRARVAWRVRRGPHGVAVEGMADTARFRLTAPAVNPSRPRAGNALTLPAASG
ncbi:MAG: hypothetical protein ACP5U2_06980 [Bryobacteraceae bacterium]